MTEGQCLHVPGPRRPLRDPAGGLSLWRSVTSSPGHTASVAAAGLVVVVVVEGSVLPQALPGPRNPLSNTRLNVSHHGQVRAGEKKGSSLPRREILLCADWAMGIWGLGALPFQVNLLETRPPNPGVFQDMKPSEWAMMASVQGLEMISLNIFSLLKEATGQETVPFHQVALTALSVM